MKDLIEKNFLHKSKNLLSNTDVTEELVLAKYGEFGAYRAKINSEVVRDMVDHDQYNNLTGDHKLPVFMVDCIGPDIPLIGYNRSVFNGNQYCVLWPLAYHEGIARKGQLDSLRFADKKNSVIFRGALSSEFKSVKHSSGLVKVSRLEYLDAASKHDAPWADLGLNMIPVQVKSKEGYQNIEGLINKLRKNSISQEAHFDYKYILCLEGADISSGFGAALASNSVPFHPFPFCYHVWYFNGLMPWVHFVPLSTSGDDLARVYEYCESNPEHMEYIANNGRLHMQKMLDDNLISEVKRKVVSLWNLK